MAHGGSVFMQRGRTDSKILGKRFDADGNVVEVESREDEEQNVKLEATVELLLAAGYFRARIKGLSPFDKVVGGMTWCIETCNFDVDVDLLFQENLTIGQKIALTEKIVAVLPKMKCPHRLEPHQIQGLDFIHIFPVVQWLVKHAIETREEMGDTIRSYSIFQFNKSFETTEDENFNELKSKSVATMGHVLEVYKPRRRYRRTAQEKIKEEALQVHSTLLEYGKHAGMGKSRSNGSKQDNVDGEVEDAKAAEEQVRTLMSGMSAAEDMEHTVTLQSEEIRQLVSAYANEFDSTSDGANETLGGIQHHNRIAASLNKQITQRAAALEEFEKQHGELREKYLTAQQKLGQVVALNEHIDKEMKSFVETEAGDKKSTLDKLGSLLAMNERLKKEEHEFKANCKEEKARLQAKVDELQSNNLEDDSEDQERNQLIDTQYQAGKDKLHRIRLLLARKNREIASIQRKLDEVPSRAELSQYQRRFIELYNQVAAKHKETKQFYTLYNTLDDTKLYLIKEVNMLNSILDNFTEAMASNSAKEQFLKQFEQIVEGIKVNKSKLEKKKQEEKMRRDHLSDTYLDLVEKQRLYFKMVKDLKEECRKNELLVSKMKGHGQ